MEFRLQPDRRSLKKPIPACGPLNSRSRQANVKILRKLERILCQMTNDKWQMTNRSQKSSLRTAICHFAKALSALSADLRVMAVSAMTQVRLDPHFPRAGCPCHEFLLPGPRPTGTRMIFQPERRVCSRLEFQHPPQEPEEIGEPVEIGEDLRLEAGCFVEPHRQPLRSAAYRARNVERGRARKLARQ